MGTFAVYFKLNLWDTLGGKPEQQWKVFKQYLS